MLEEQRVKEFDIYRYINSPDIEKCCRKLNHQFTTAEQVKVVYMSYLPIEDKMQGYDWLIENAQDSPIPNKYCNIPYYAMAYGGYTAEERRTRTKVYHGRDSVLSYLKDCIKSGILIEPNDGLNNIESIDVKFPNPYKVGDLLEHIVTNEIYVVESIKDETRSQHMLGLRYIKDKRIYYEFCLELSDLQYWYTVNRRPFPSAKSFIYHLGKFYKNKKTLVNLLEHYAEFAGDIFFFKEDRENID